MGHTRVSVMLQRSWCLDEGYNVQRYWSLSFGKHFTLGC